MSQPTTYQHELHELMPGSPGGRALAAARGRAYFAELGRRGGLSTARRYGSHYMRIAGTLGALVRWRRLHTQPRTIRAWDGITYRQVPYWPPKTTQRRRRPLFVRIELEGGEA